MPSNLNGKTHVMLASGPLTVLQPVGDCVLAGGGGGGGGGGVVCIVGDRVGARVVGGAGGGAFCSTGH